ncbi:MAG TPA: HepT-like ribonuclease domain-containing protein [Patescibacteria group bacterium]|nr:HepT-like ribonuclease domain-containing protein [Patescibacteria group bacterium]
MPREIRAYLLDIIEACDAIISATRDLDLDAYRSNRLIRSSVEREFITIGEAVGAMSRLCPELFD